MTFQTRSEKLQRKEQRREENEINVSLSEFWFNRCWKGENKYSKEMFSIYKE